MQASNEMQKRVAYLEIQLSAYRAVADRARIVQQFMAVGQLLGYRALDKYHIGEGMNDWADYASFLMYLHKYRGNYRVKKP